MIVRNWMIQFIGGNIDGTLTVYTSVDGWHIYLQFDRIMINPIIYPYDFSTTLGTISSISLLNYTMYDIVLTAQLNNTSSGTISYTGTDITDYLGNVLRSFSLVPVTNNVGSDVYRLTPGLEILYDFVTGSTVVDGLVMAQSDDSGIGEDMSQAAASSSVAPAFISGKGVKIDSTTDLLTSLQLLNLSTDPYTMFIVWEDTAALSVTTLGSSVNRPYELGVVPNRKFYAAGTGIYSSAFQTNYVSAEYYIKNKVKIHTHVYNGPSSFTQVNGERYATNVACGTSVLINAAMKVKGFTSTDNEIIYKIVGYNRLLTTVEIAAIEAQLMSEYPAYIPDTSSAVTPFDVSNVTMYAIGDNVLNGSNPADGASVPIWYNLNNVSNNFVATNAPTYNLTNHTIVYDGVNDASTSGALITNLSDFAIITCFKINDYATFDVTRWLWDMTFVDASDTTAYTKINLGRNTGKFTLTVRNETGTATVYNFPINECYNIACIWINGTTIYCRINDIYYSTTITWVAPESHTDMVLGTRGNITWWANVSFGGIVVIDGSVTENQINGHIQFLRTKYPEAIL
jgi:hypothetical protein